MSVQNEGDGVQEGQVEGESTGKHSLAATMKTSVVWLVVILAILAALTWVSIEFELLPKGSPK